MHHILPIASLSSRYLACVLCLIAPFAARAESQTLEEAWVAAYRNNPSLEAERANLRADDEKVSQALSGWRPNVDATAKVGRTEQKAAGAGLFGTDSDFAHDTREYGLQFKQPLFNGFQTVAETEAAKKQVLSERARLVDAEQQLFLDTAKAFLGVLRDGKALELLRDNESVLQQKLTETRVRAGVGELSQTDVRQAESRLARAHVSQFQAEDALEQDRALYARLVGRSPEHLEAPSLTVDDSVALDDVLHRAETGNPNVIAAQYAVEQARAQIRQNEGPLLPEVDLVGNTGRNYGQDITIPGREDSSQMLVEVSIPLYHAGRDYSQTREAQQTLTQRLMERDEALNRAHEGAANAMQAFASGARALDADKTEVDSAARALEGVKEESRIGTRTTLDVLNAQQELLDAEIDQTKSHYDRDYAVLQIRSAMGELTAEHLKLPTGIYDPELHYNDVKQQWAGFSQGDARYKVPALPVLASP